MDKKKILIIEDDPAIQKGIIKILEAENFDIVGCKDGGEGFEKAISNKYDLIILDITLPSMNGYDICRGLREKKYDKPIIMLTSKSDQTDKIVGLEVGADDYITKPFDIRELIARVRANLRKYSREKQTIPEQESLTDKDHKRLLKAIMFTDIKDYSKKMHENENEALEVLKLHNKIMKDAIAKYDGRIIEIVGDSFLAIFDSALDAINCAVNVQKILREYSLNKNWLKKIEVRIGIHLGDVLVVDEKIKGDSVNITSRIQDIAEPGEIFISKALYSVIKNKINYDIIKLGKFNLKNIKTPVRVYKVCTN
ncbi:response regulator [Bacteroidota bacterium]